MFRVLLCLPLCLLLAPHEPQEAPPDNDGPARPAVVADDKSALPDADEMKRLARTDPIAFLEACVRRYQRTVKGYTCTLQKQERIGGRLLPREVIDVRFREQPFSVFFDWKEGARLASSSLYVEGENDGMMLVRPAGRLARLATGGAVVRDPEGRDARQSGRYTIKDFGIKKGMLRTIGSWKAALADDALHVEYLGEKKIEDAGDRACYVFHRSKYRKPEYDGVSDLTLFIDKETWLQVGSVLKGDEGQLIGAYYFRDIRLNPEFKPQHFERAALR